MNPNDPDFPEEIPAIPAPRDETPLTELPTQSSPTADAGKELSRNLANGSASVNHSPELPINAMGHTRNSDAWSELDESDPPHLADVDTDSSSSYPSVKDLKKVEPVSAMGRSGSTNAEQREAEKPVGVTVSYDDWVEEEVPYQPKELGVIDQFLLLLADGATTWRKFLRWVRSLLPPDLQRQLPDELLTALLLGLLMLFLALWNPLGRKAASPVLVVDDKPAIAEVQVNQPDANPIADEVPASVPPSPGLEPSLVEELEPEQTRIAEIQAQVSRISRAYATGLIQSVEVNLPENSLIVNIGENWYGLVKTQQDVVAQELYERAKELEFGTLKLRDPEGMVVARNPVVGPEAVVLKRSRSADADLLIP